MGVAGPRLRAALTGRAVLVGADPGLHPGLVELALQAEIAEGSLVIGHWSLESGKWQVASGKWQVGSGKWEVGSQALRAKALVCLRPVRPVPSAWHEMPGQDTRETFAL